MIGVDEYRVGVVVVLRGLWGFAWVRVAGQVELAEALDTARESVAIYERLAGQLPQAFTRDLHGALTTLADVLDHLCRDGEAGKVRQRIHQLGE